MSMLPNKRTKNAEIQTEKQKGVNCIAEGAFTTLRKMELRRIAEAGGRKWRLSKGKG